MGFLRGGPPRPKAGIAVHPAGRDSLPHTGARAETGPYCHNRPAGRFDGFYEHNLKAWDSAAGFLIVEEAGGKVTDFNGDYYSPYQPRIAATNGLIHEELLLAVNGKWNPEKYAYKAG